MRQTRCWHRHERQVGEEVRAWDRNGMAELELKMVEPKREMQIADTLHEIRIRNARIERGEGIYAGENGVARIRRVAEEERSRAYQEDEKITGKTVMEEMSQCEQHPGIDFCREGARMSQERTAKMPTLYNLVEMNVGRASLGLDYGSDSD
jgi:hypothetical protein